MKKTKDQLVAAAQSYADALHTDGCDLAIAIGFSSELQITVSGMWVPDTQLAVFLLESVLKSIRSGDATIVDLRKRGE